MTINIKNIWRNTKITFGVVSALVMLGFITYMSIAQNHDNYDFDKYLKFVQHVAVYCVFITLLIIILVYIFSDKQNILSSLEKVLEYCSYILSIGFVGVVFGSVVLLGDKKVSWLEAAGALVIWGFFINIYLIIAYRVVKKTKRSQ